VGVEVVDPKELPRPVAALVKKHRLTTLGIDGRMPHAQFLRLRKQLRPARLKLSTVVREARGVKSAGEIRLLRKAQRKAEGIFAAALEEIRPGVTEQHIHNRIVQLILDDESLDGPSFDPIASAGASSWTFHSRCTGRKLRKTDCLIIDMGVRYQGYCSDMTRTVFLGKPTRRMREVYGIVHEAQRRGVETIRAGASGGEVAAAAWEFIGERGYEQSHGLGHGVGLETHDPPAGGLSKANKNPLQAGMVLTVEPGIYLKDAFGVRIEDTVVVTPGGCENLMRTPKELTIVG
jgi:Xaa-Pro aminopeptidase